VHHLVKKIDVLPETLPGERRTRLDFPHLSASQLAMLSRCGKAYYFARVLHLPEPVSSAAHKGIAFHNGMTAFFRAKRDGADLAACLAAAKATASAYLATTLRLGPTGESEELIDFAPRWQRGPLDTPSSMHIDVLAAIEHAVAIPAVAAIRPLTIERGYVIFWKDEKTLPLVGYSDVVDALGDGAAVTDWKTSMKIKGPWTLAMDPAQIGYALGAQADLGLPIYGLRYASLGWEAPHGENEAASIVFAMQSIDFDERRVERLYLRCREATEDLAAQRFRYGDSDAICPPCAFRYACSARFGQLDVHVLDATQSMRANEDASCTAASDTPARAEATPLGASQRQRAWIREMLLQSSMTLAQACQQSGIRTVGFIDALSKRDASALIETLKPLAERAQADRQRHQAIRRQIIQARTALRGLPETKARLIRERYGLSGEMDIDTADRAFAVHTDIGRLYARGHADER
jgi:hypothetical protein